MNAFAYVVFVLLVVIFVHCYIHYFSRNGKFVNQLPGLPIVPLFGNLFDFLNEPFEDWFLLIRKVNKIYYPIHKIWLLGLSLVVIQHPDDAEVLLSSTKHIEKCWGYNFLTPWLGTGLLTSTGTKWQKRRKMITPAFHFNILRDFVEVFVEESEKLVKSIKEKGSETIEHVDHLSEKYTLYTICESAMGTSLRGWNEAEEYMETVRQMGKMIAYRAARPWFQNNWLFSWTPKGFEQKRLLDKLHKCSRKIIAERKLYFEKMEAQKKTISLRDDDCLNPNDDTGVRKKRMAMLDLLISAYRNEAQIDDAGIQEEVDTFIFEGYDTTGAALCYTILLLAEHRDIQEKARQEVDQVLNESGGKIGMVELQSFSFLERCIKEALRLYPSVPLISRGIKQDIKLKNFLVTPNSSIHLHIYDVHRDPNFWPDPLKFDPDRFLPERIQGRHPYSYIPFSAGPRNCIGQKFAMLELKTAAAHILHNFYMEPIELAHQAKIYPDLTLKLTPPVRAKFILREK